MSKRISPRTDDTALFSMAAISRPIASVGSSPAAVVGGAVVGAALVGGGAVVAGADVACVATPAPSPLLASPPPSPPHAAAANATAAKTAASLALRAFTIIISLPERRRRLLGTADTNRPAASISAVRGRAGSPLIAVGSWPGLWTGRREPAALEGMGAGVHAEAGTAVGLADRVEVGDLVL